MKKFTFPAWTVPPALLALCLVSYGLLIPRLGYYWDDWPAIWFAKFYGISSLQEVLGIDRPLLAWLYMLTTGLIGDWRPGWQFFALLMRWVSCLVLWWTLLQIWPKRRYETLWVVFLFAIYPGFRQQYIALIYSHDWIVISMFFASIGLMLAALRKPKRFWLFMILSWLLAAYAMFADEYYFGLELLRPVLLWIVLAETIPERRKRLGRVMLYWLPYIAIMLSFLVWRLFIHVSPRGQVQMFNQLSNNPLLGVVNLAKTVGADILESGLVAWSLPFKFQEVIDSGLTSIYVYGLLALVVAGLCILFLERLRLTGVEGEPPARKWAVQAILLGLFALFIGGWPFWATAWQIGLTFPWDRFNLAMALGACLLLGGLISLVFWRKLAAVIALGVVIGLGSASAYHLANQYRQDWDLLRQFFWQMSWRVPAIAPDTVVVTNRSPFTYATDNSLTAPLNWIYAPDNRSRQLPYLFYDVDAHSPKMWASITPGQAVNQQYRILDFNGRFGESLSLFFKPPNCLKVLDPVADGELPGKPWYITSGTAYSDLNRIITDPAQARTPPESLLGSEPAHDWCYFFEKAELARQMGDWPLAASLADQALADPPEMTEANVLEWTAFIEAYANTGRWAEAEELAHKVYLVHPKMRRTLCSLWERVERSAPASPQRDETLGRQMESLQCGIID